MKKMELREQGNYETMQHPKKFAVTVLWIISTLIIIAVNIVASASNVLMRDNRILDFFHRIAYSIDVVFRTYAVTSAVYLILWGLILLMMYLISKKSAQSTKLKTALMVTLLIILIASVVFFFVALASENYNNSFERQPAFFGVFDIMLSWLLTKINLSAIAVMMVLFEFIYLALKLAVTRIFCSDGNSIRFKFLHGMPACYCTEALRPWETAAVYLFPFAFINAMLFILNVRSGNEFIINALFMAFITSFDISPVIYSWLFKVKDKAEYISIDQHIYEVTLFQK